jgi:hypothetical protein
VNCVPKGNVIDNWVYDEHRKAEEGNCTRSLTTPQCSIRQRGGNRDKQSSDQLRQDGKHEWFAKRRQQGVEKAIFEVLNGTPGIQMDGDA